MTKKQTTVILISFFIVLSTIFISYSYYETQKHPRSLPTFGNPGHKVGNFSFTNQDGKTITQNDVNGKIRVVEYFFTTCKGICPRMNENMSKVYQEFRGNKEVLILSHSVDPKKDTVGAMKAYSMRFDADAGQWMFLTGDKQQLYDMARNDYLVTAVDDTATKDITTDFIHTDRFILVDRNGNIRGQYEGTKPEGIAKLIEDIKALLKTDE